MTVLHKDIGDTLGGLGGDTSAPRLRGWPLMSPSILSCAWRSRSGLMTRRWGGLDVLRRARTLPKVVLRVAQARHDRRAAAVLEPKTRRPKSSPSKLSDEAKQRALAVRAALEASGLDHGPISVHEKTHIREAGVARLAPKKKPRSAWRRFVYPAPMRAGNSTRPSMCSAAWPTPRPTPQNQTTVTEVLIHKLSPMS